MESSRILVAPGLRTIADPGWRARLSSALKAVSRQPQLWLLGMVGFLLRGGVLILAAPIVVLPTQVEARLLIGDHLGSMGFTGGFWVLVALAALGALALSVAVLALLARIELWAFEGLIEDPVTAHSRPLDAVQPSRHARRRLLLKLFGIQVLTVVAVAVAAAPLVSTVGQKAFDEIVRPSSSSSIYARVLSGVGEPFFLFVIGLVLIEMVSALATRELLVRHTGWRGNLAAKRHWLMPVFGSALARLFVSPLRTLATAALGWAAMMAVLVPAFWAISIAWQAVRAAFLISVGFSDGREVLGMVLVALALSGAFIVAVALGGFASALRAALWSVERLR